MGDQDDLVDMLNNFFNAPDGPALKTPVVILHPEEPSQQLLGCLNSRNAMFRVTYLRGSARSARDLERAKLVDCGGVFVMNNGSAHAAREAMDRTDVASIMHTLGIRNSR